MDSSGNRTCVIHFDGKKGEQKRLTAETLSKIIERRREWLNLPDSYKEFTEVAKKSFEFISESVALNKNDIPENLVYHIQCYRNFTDKTKIERAKTTLSNASRKRSICETANKNEATTSKPQKAPRTTRQSGSTSCQSSSTSNVLPKICLVCKRPGPIYITHKVTLFHCF